MLNICCHDSVLKVELCMTNCSMIVIISALLGLDAEFSVSTFVYSCVCSVAAQLQLKFILEDAKYRWRSAYSVFTFLEIGCWLMVNCIAYSLRKVRAVVDYRHLLSKIRGLGEIGFE